MYTTGTMIRVNKEPSLLLQLLMVSNLRTSQTARSRSYFATVCMLTLVLSLVVVAGLIRNACLVCVSVDSQMIASVTGARPPAVNHVLD